MGRGKSQRQRAKGMQAIALQGQTKGKEGSAWARGKGNKARQGKARATYRMSKRGSKPPQQGVCSSKANNKQRAKTKEEAKGRQGQGKGQANARQAFKPVCFKPAQRAWGQEKCFRSRARQAGKGHGGKVSQSSPDTEPKGYVYVLSWQRVPTKSPALPKGKASARAGATRAKGKGKFPSPPIGSSALDDKRADAVWGSNRSDAFKKWVGWPGSDGTVFRACS